MRGQPVMGGGGGMPALPPWVRNLLIGLFALYVVELLVVNAIGDGVYALLAWYGFGNGLILPWQPITRYLVQGRDVLGVAFGLLALFFILPPVDQLLTKKQLSHSMIAAVVGSIALAAIFDALGFVSGVSMGWTSLVSAILALFGLVMPGGVIRLWFVLPIKASWITWGTGVIAALMVLASHSLDSAAVLGSWAGVIAWWYGLGPGARRRKLIHKSQKIERELKKFQVINGGRNDDIVH